MTDCLIVGAGISGLLAAHTLQNAGVNVTVLDKGRGVGGRMATRRLEQGRGRADHGAQFFTVRSATFQTWVDQWLAAGVVQEWSRGFPPKNPNDGHPRYRGTNGMSDIAKHLAKDVTVHTNTRVAKIEQGEQWIVTTTDDAVFTADALLLTPPVLQSLDLLAAGNVSLPAETRQQLEKLAYDPCFAVMVTLDGPSNLPAPGAIQVNGEPITWIGDNQMKGISERPAVTIHASPAFTRDHFEDEDRTAVGQLLVDEAHKQGWLDKSLVREMQVQRWKFAQPTSYHTERTLLVNTPLPLAFAGDVFYEAKVEGAALSGLAAAEALLPHLR